MIQEKAESLLFARTKARELTNQELSAVAGGDACFYCVRDPQGPNGHDEKIYGPD